ncbi:MAG: hypothetical protein Q4A59_04580 [Erysipelotrichaceae bacterium]|nr:hypothetical protein [Erysipelotrichaceae bacterium]
MKQLKRALPLALANLLILNSTIPTLAAEQTNKTPSSSEKEEVIYTTLDASGKPKSSYVVNSFSKGNITDYGNYDSVKMLNTSDEIKQNGDTITFSTEAKKAYYEGKLKDTKIPWNITLHYYLDGKEYSPQEMAGKSGKLKIRFQITKNTACTGDFYNDYALQTTFKLDTDQFTNISAPAATIANVGASKQLTYTILPGEGIDTTITADVKNFEMDAVAINGIHLNLNVDIDDKELKGKVNQLIGAVDQLDNGATALSSGSENLLNGSNVLKNGASSLKSGVTSLDEGVVTLQDGLTTVQDGLNTLNSKSGTLTSGSSEFKAALKTIQTAVNSVSVTNKDLSALTDASGQIKQGITDLYNGASTLQTNLGYSQYKAIMAQNGVSIDSLLAGNSSAASSLAGIEAQLDQIAATSPETADQVAAIKGQLSAASSQISSLLAGDSAAIGGMQSYLDGVAGQLPTLTEGLNSLNTQYATFDSSINKLVSGLGNMTGNLSALADGINKLVDSYEQLDTGINDYTDGVAQIVAGYTQVMGGVSSLAQGSKELVSGTGELYDGTVELYDGVTTLCDGAQQMADGTGEFRLETSNMDHNIDQEINTLLKSIGGDMDNPVSFVSTKNTHVDSVQFVIQTEAIESEKTEEKVVNQEEDTSFWQKLQNLFKHDQDTNK